MKWKAGLIFLSALSFVFASQSRLVWYLAEEALTVVLGIAVFLTLGWIILTTFLMLWQGASLVFLQLKQIIRGGSSKAEQPLVLHRR